MIGIFWLFIFKAIKLGMMQAWRSAAQTLPQGRRYLGNMGGIFFSEFYI
jgi:hypothetical protein